MTEPTQQAPSKEKREKDIADNKDVAAVSYLWILSVIVYFSRKDSPFVQYHAKQGIVLFLLSVPVWFIPFVGQLFVLVLAAGMVMGFLNAFQGHYKDVPLAGPLSRGEMSLLQAWQQIWSHLKRFFEPLVKPKHPKKETQETPAPSPAPSDPPTTPPDPPSATLL